MQSLKYPGKGKKKSSFRQILGVSEAVGTVLLLGISITLAGGIAVWTANIDEGEEGLYVDLWATVRGDYLVIIHRGGDHIQGTNTRIIVSDPGSGPVIEGSYYELSDSGDESWSPGEEISVNISDASIPDIFTVTITSVLEGGTSTVILQSELMKSGTIGSLPDLAVTLVQFLNVDGEPITTLYETGTYFLRIHVENYGADMTTVHFNEQTGNSISNLRIFDSEEPMSFSEVFISHYNPSGIELDPDTNPRFGELRHDENMSFTFNWTVGSSLPRSLGIHTLNVKINPVFNGELNYRNNYVQRNFKVDKELIPLQIHGPDPGIYDIYFSNDAPHSGDEVTVTVIIQNSGDESVTPDQHVNLIVSTWEPVMRNVEGDSVPDWKMDYTGHYENWRSEDNDFELQEDNIFPTCVKLDIELLPGAYLFFYFTLEARVDVPGGEQLVYAAIDAYQDSEDPQGIHYLDGDQWKDNKNFGIIQVLPRILLVDDDNANTGSESDMSSSVLESLIGSGVTIDKVFAAKEVTDEGVPRDAPAFSYNQAEIPAPAMEDYDIVIWVTGFDEDPLTNRPKVTETDPGGNVQEMMEYMDSNKYLLIVGTSPFDGFTNYFIDGITLSYPLPAPQTTIDASLFLYEYLGIKKIDKDQNLPVGPGQYLYGTDTGPDGLTPPPDIGLDYTIELDEQEADNHGMTFFLPRDAAESSAAGLETPVGVMTTEEEKDFALPRYNFIRSFSTPDIDHHNAQYRSAVIGWNITQIKFLNEKIDLFANTLKWFDWKVQVGRDLAITRMNLYIITEAAEGVWENIPVDEDSSPKYLDTVLLEVYVRNNGPDLESTSIIFYVTGPDGIELPITPNIPDPRNELDEEEYDNPADISGLVGQGGETIVYKLWLAIGVGTYTFRVVVDPFHLVTEINEQNNDISYSTSTVTSFITKNNILVVDDDFSDNNFALDETTQSRKGEMLIDYSLSGSGETPSTAILTTLDDLGYEYDIHIVENEVVGGVWDYQSDLSILDLKRFNSVIWIVGDSGPRDILGRETFTDQDFVAMKRYLDGDYPEAQYLPEDHHENLMVIGSNVISDITTQLTYVIDYFSDGILYSFTIGEFIENYFGIEASVPVTRTAQGVIGPQEGAYTTDIYLGVSYRAADFTGPFDYEPVSPLPISEVSYPRNGLLVDDGLGGLDVISHQYDLEDDSRKFKFVLHSWQVQHASYATIEGPLQEMIFLPLHWFNTPDWRSDLVGRSCKMTIDEENPVIGSSYLIQAEIANLGGVAGGGTVRFMDGPILIKSENVYLDTDRTTTLEAIWRPNFAGERSISLWIDLYNDYDEVFDVSNNRPVITKSVLIFWDDMESGDDNWEHDSTVMLINGESPLDYLGEPTDTNIESTWELIDGFHLNSEVDNPTVENIYHSSPSSYYMYEPDQGNLNRKPLDLVLVLDTSGSMDNDGWDDEIGDYQPIGNMKTAAINLINQMRSDDRLMIMFFHSGGYLAYYALAYMDDVGKENYKKNVENLQANNLAPLWDGIGYSIDILRTNLRAEAFPSIITMTDGDDFGAGGWEDGSQVFCPGSEIGGSWKTSTWGALTGARYGGAPFKYLDQDLTLGHDIQRTYEYDLLYEQVWEDLDAGFESREGLIYSPIPVYTVGLGIVPHEADPLNPIISSYPFTTEYDMRMISETSKASYEYLSSSDGLKQTFQDIFDQIESNAGGTRSSTPTRAIGPWSDGLELPSDKKMETWDIDLTYADNAELSFNHKYNLKSGTNGGIIQVYHDDPVEGPGWEYIQPDQPYTGNLLDGSILDDFNHPIRWCWNGLSGGGTMDWDHVTIDMNDYVGGIVRVRFQYYHFEGGTGYGWFIDDVSVKISTEADNPFKKDSSTDNWALITAATSGIESYSGDHSWFCGVTSNGGDLNSGVDNSLYTRQIDLTNVRTARLHAMVKFNIDREPDRPPDGFRIEVSINNKQTWVPLNLGVRSSWGVSGTDADADDGIPGDNKAYTGLDLDGNGNYWVPLGTLTRVNADLSAFTGNVVNIRFRIVTNTDIRHYDLDASPDPLFRGVYIDDVLISGESLGSTRSGSAIIETEDSVLNSIEIQLKRESRAIDEPLESTHGLDMDQAEEDVNTDEILGRITAVGSFSILLIIPALVVIFSVIAGTKRIVRKKRSLGE